MDLILLISMNAMGPFKLHTYLYIILEQDTFAIMFAFLLLFLSSLLWEINVYVYLCVCVILKLELSIRSPISIPEFPIILSFHAFLKMFTKISFNTTDSVFIVIIGFLFQF